MAWISMIAAAAAALTQPTAQPAPVQVMVLGTYHFDNPGLDLNNAKADDVLKPQRQRELEALAAAIAEFQPTKIMLERVSADLLDPNYAKFTLADLGKKRDERVQISYRIANQLGHEKVYAIDEQPGPGEPDYFPFDKLTKWAAANGAQPRIDAMMEKGAALTKNIEALQKTHSIAGVLAERNDPQATQAEQGFYYETLDIGDAEQQPGADLNAMWYLRNAKIFAKLQQVAEPGDRVLVVYGSGHNYWLRHFAETTPGYVNVDPVPYLKKAAATTR